MIDKMKIFVEIPARGGSKGVPRKALRQLGGKPLIAWTIDHALTIQNVTKVFVNTDDADIRDVSIACGAEVPFLRPSAFSGDDSSLEQAVKYSYDWYRDNEDFVPDIFIVMSPTYPFRRTNLINDALKKCFDEPDIFNLSSVASSRVALDSYRIKNKGITEIFDFPVVSGSKPDAFYQSAMSFNIVLNNRPVCQNCRVPFYLNEIESIDIDEQKDFELAQLVIEEGLYPFEL